MIHPEELRGGKGVCLPPPLPLSLPPPFTPFLKNQEIMENCGIQEFLLFMAKKEGGGLGRVKLKEEGEGGK